MEYIGSMPSRKEAWDDEEGEVDHHGKALSSETYIQLDDTSLFQSHRWVFHKILEPMDMMVQHNFGSSRDIL